MRALNIFAVVVVVLLSGCATTGYGNYGQNNAGLLGASGAIVGSAVSNNSGLGIVVGGLTGYYLGQEMDRQSEIQGSTTCRATLRRTYNRDGSIASVQQNSEHCYSTFRTPGYRTGYNR